MNVKSNFAKLTEKLFFLDYYIEGNILFAGEVVHCICGFYCDFETL